MEKELLNDFYCVAIGKYLEDNQSSSINFEIKCLQGFGQAFLCFNSYSYDEESWYFRAEVSYQANEGFMSNDVADTLKTFMLLHDYHLLSCTPEQRSIKEDDVFYTGTE